jgi:hypothetical protein
MYKLTIQNTAQVKVKFTLKDKGIDRLFTFTLDAVRLEQDEITDRLEDKNKKIKDFMADGIITGWEGQRLVLNEDDTPAAFSPEALDVLLNVPGVAAVIFNAYLKDCGAKEKN